jgi:superfamily I DNA/RNA helicase
LDSLNEPQREGVVNVEGACMIVAGAGSGKTRVLTYRIAYLIHTLGEDPFSIFGPYIYQQSGRGDAKQDSRYCRQ